MGLFNKKKKPDEIQDSVVDPIEQVFGGQPKKPAAVQSKVTTVTPAPAQKPVPKTVPKQVQRTHLYIHPSMLMDMELKKQIFMMVRRSRKTI